MDQEKKMESCRRNKRKGRRGGIRDIHITALAADCLRGERGKEPLEDEPHGVGETTPGLFRGAWAEGVGAGQKGPASRHCGGDAWRRRETITLLPAPPPSLALTIRTVWHSGTRES